MLGKIFKLPSKSTLSKILQGSGISPGISDKVMHALKIKANQMSIEDRQCVLLFDEMSLKYGLTYNPHGDFIEGFENYGNFGSTQHISNHALCFMVRGLKQKWKQPLAYFLSSNTTPSQTLKCITKSIITQLKDINLNVKVLICDQGSSNRSFLGTNEHVNSTQPYFYVNNQKLFVMYCLCCLVCQMLPVSFVIGKSSSRSRRSASAATVVARKSRGDSLTVGTMIIAGNVLSLHMKFRPFNFPHGR